MRKTNQEMELNDRISIRELKHRFAEKFPDSPILQTILSMPDEISAEELIGASAILLGLLDSESHNNLKGVIKVGRP